MDDPKDPGKEQSLWKKFFDEVDNVFVTSGDLMRGDNTARLYENVSRAAFGMGSNNIAYDYAQKAVQASPDIRYRLLLVSASCELGDEKARNGDLNAAFTLFNNGITNFESISNLGTNDFPKAILRQVYWEGAQIAARVGRTTEASQWYSKQLKY